MKILAHIDDHIGQVRAYHCKVLKATNNATIAAAVEVRTITTRNMLTNDLYLKDHDSVGHISTTISSQLVRSHMGEYNPIAL
jgi:hypothetical protein